jgi:hypothetical protein
LTVPTFQLCQKIALLCNYPCSGAEQIADLAAANRVDRAGALHVTPPTLRCPDPPADCRFLRISG